MTQVIRGTALLLTALVLTTSCSNNDSKNSSAAATPQTQGNEYPNGRGPVGPNGHSPRGYGDCPQLSGNYVLQNGTDLATVQSRPYTQRRGGRGSRDAVVMYYMNNSQVPIVADGQERPGGQGQRYVARCRRNPFPTLEMQVSSHRGQDLYYQYASPSGDGSVMTRRIQTRGGNAEMTTWIRKN